MAVRIRGPCASHPISAFWAVVDNIKATPSVWGASSSSCPENRSISPVANLLCPEPVHLDSLIPSKVSLLFLISAATCAVFPFSNMVLTFHAPMVVVVLVEMMVVCLAASRSWLSLPGVISSPAEDSSSPRTEMSFGFSLVCVFVAVCFFYREGVLGPSPNPPPFSSWTWDQAMVELHFVDLDLKKWFCDIYSWFHHNKNVTLFYVAAQVK